MTEYRQELLPLERIAAAIDRPLKVVQGWVESGLLSWRAILTPVLPGYSATGRVDRGVRFGKPVVVYALADAERLSEGSEW